MLREERGQGSRGKNAAPTRGVGDVADAPTFTRW